MYDIEDKRPWSSDRDILASGIGGENGDKLAALIDGAAALAKAGDLTAAAASLEAVRRMLVSRDYFRRYDNDIWAFMAIIECIRRESPEADVPAAYQRLIDASPPMQIDKDLSAAQKAFWYGRPDAQVGGVMCLVPSHRLRSSQLNATQDNAVSKPWLAIAGLGLASVVLISLAVGAVRDQNVGGAFALLLLLAGVYAGQRAFAKLRGHR